MMSQRLAASGLHAVTLGAGRPVVVLHGGPGFDHGYLRPWLDPLSAVAQLIYVDQRGMGRSRDSGPVSELDHDTWARDVDTVRRVMGHERITVLGHSWGAFIALEYAVRHDVGIEALILCSAAPALAHMEGAMALARERATDAAYQTLLTALGTPAVDDNDLADRWRAVLPLYFFRPTDALVEQVHCASTYSAAAFNRGMFECIPDYDVRPYLREITVPVLVVSGRHDWITSPQHGAEPLAQGIPDARLHICERSGHFPFVEENDEALQVMSDFLDGLPVYTGS